MLPRHAHERGARRALVLAAAACLVVTVAGCHKAPACNPGTVMLYVTLDGTSSQADAIDVKVLVNNELLVQPTTLTHTPGSTSGSIEVQFPSMGGYPVGKRLDITLVARANDREVGTGSEPIAALPAGCATLDIFVVGAGPDGGAGSGGHGGAIGTGGATGVAGHGGASGAGGRGGANGTGGAGGVAGHGGTGGGAGSGGKAGAGGTGGTAGGGAGGTGGAPGCGWLNTFAVSGEGFAPNVWAGDTGNLFDVPDGGTPATLSWASEEGESGNGALRIDAPFSDYRQFVNVQRQFGGGDLRNWTGVKMHVRVKIASGVAGDPQSPPTVAPFVQSQDGWPDGGSVKWNYFGGNLVVPAGNGWNDYAIDLSAATTPFDPSTIVAFGVQVFSGSPGGSTPTTKPAPGVVFIDSFWLEGTCPAGAAAPNCDTGLTRRPSSALITDFSDATLDPMRPGNLTFGGGSPQKLQGGTYLYASGPLGSLTLTGDALTFSATVEPPAAANGYPWSGVGMFLSGTACVDASDYSGLSFTLETTGNCTARVGLSTPETSTPLATPEAGTCLAAQCFSSSFNLGPSTTMIAFGQTPDVNGQPTPGIDKNNIQGLQFSLNATPDQTNGCSGTITISKLSFY
jgi:hypothetical protein